MSADCYAESIRRLLKSEGGYVNHPSDPGGPTNFAAAATPEAVHAATSGKAVARKR